MKLINWLRSCWVNTVKISAKMKIACKTNEKLFSLCLRNISVAWWNENQMQTENQKEEKQLKSKKSSFINRTRFPPSDAVISPDQLDRHDCLWINIFMAQKLRHEDDASINVDSLQLLPPIRSRITRKSAIYIGNRRKWYLSPFKLNRLVNPFQRK